MESNAHYKAVGLSVLLLLAGLIITGIWLSVGFDTRGYKLYSVYMSDGVAGLSTESQVKYSGVAAGNVRSINISKSDPHMVRIVIKVYDNIPISENTYATMVTQGITGSTYLGLGSSATPIGSLYRVPSDPYPVIISRPSFYKRIENTVSEIDSAIKKLLTDENINNFSASLDNLHKITDAVARNDDDIDKIMNALPEVMQKIDKAVVKFTEMTTSIDAATADVKTTMLSGKESFEKITRQAIPPVILLIHRLDTIAANLEDISTQMRQNPSVIIRGSTPPTPGPGE